MIRVPPAVPNEPNTRSLITTVSSSPGCSALRRATMFGFRGDCSSEIRTADQVSSGFFLPTTNSKQHLQLITKVIISTQQNIFLKYTHTLLLSHLSLQPTPLLAQSTLLMRNFLPRRSS